MFLSCGVTEAAEDDCLGVDDEVPDADDDPGVELFGRGLLEGVGS